METEYFHPHEVANLLKIPRRSVKRLADAGKLPAIVLPDGEYRFPRVELEKTLRAWHIGRTDDIRTV